MRYTWSAGFAAADGTAFTGLLATLDGGGCFEGQCDWRLPTRAELQTTLSTPCTTDPCIEQGIFAPTAAGFYWSSTTHATNPLIVWVVQLSSGQTYVTDKHIPSNLSRVRPWA